jgi:dolichol-phosphate mannosyltransferase
MDSHPNQSHEICLHRRGDYDHPRSDDRAECSRRSGVNSHQGHTGQRDRSWESSKGGRPQEYFEVTLDAKYSSPGESDRDKILAIIPIYREIGKIGNVLARFDRGVVDQICIIADDPNQDILEEIKAASTSLRVPLRLIQNPQRKGIGFAIKQGFEYALSNGYDIIVIMAGNGKDDPREIPRLIHPVISDKYDYVQGSRFLPGGRRERNPLLRGLFSRLFPVVWTWSTGVHCTDVTNGFRAYSSKLLRDPNVHVWQDWLNHYELEYYLHYKALTLGYRFTERPVSKTYPPKKQGKYTHISPLRDWWQIVGPLFLLRIGARN